MIEIGMDEWGSKNTGKSGNFARENTIIEKVDSINDFKNLYQPNQQEDNGWRYKAQDEPLVFDVGLCRQGMVGKG